MRAAFEDLNTMSEAESMALLHHFEDWLRPTVEQVRNCVLAEAIITAQDPKDEHRSNSLFVDMLSALHNGVRGGRLIDFGHLPNAMLMEQSARGATLFAAGHLGHPFSSPYVLFHTWDKGGCLYIVDPSDWHARSKGRFQQGTFLVCEAQAVMVAGAPNLVLADCALAAIRSDGKGYLGSLVPNPLKLAMQEPDERASMGNLLDPVMTMLLLLATDGVPADRIPAPDKLNKQRMKSGKPPIPPHWHVQTDGYVTALQNRGRRHAESLGGHHASPIPHLRRGHQRHLNAYHGGGTIWVRDAVVMLKDGQEVEGKLSRSFYSLQREEPHGR